MGTILILAWANLIMKKHVVWLFSFLWFTGCTSFSVLKPIKPEVGNPNKDPYGVSSLRPTLSWEPTSQEGTAYDLVIHEGTKTESFWEGTKRTIGEVVYYREALPGPSHTLELPLKPSTEYYWSVRIRRNGEVSQWSRYDYELFLVLSYMRVNDAWFRFQTPTGLH